MKLYDYVVKNIEGRFAMTEESANILQKYVVASKKKNHLEIGSLYGASAIFVGLIYEQFNTEGCVYCVDPMIGYYGNKFDVGGSGKRINDLERIFYSNVKKFNLEQRIILLKQKSSDFPFSVNFRFSTALVDGDHSYAAVYADIQNCFTNVDECIFVHDLTDIEVMAAIRKSVFPNSDWHFEDYVDIGVLSNAH